jgi:acyl CoA:acetate/3-ketoacid CoA transferase beta subunit
VVDAVITDPIDLAAAGSFQPFKLVELAPGVTAEEVARPQAIM